MNRFVLESAFDLFYLSYSKEQDGMPRVGPYGASPFRGMTRPLLLISLPHRVSASTFISFQVV